MAPISKRKRGVCWTRATWGGSRPIPRTTGSELFFPYKQIGPMVKATPYGVLNVRNTGDGLTVGFCALQKIDEKLLIRSGGKEIFTDRIVLPPMGVYEKKIPASVKKGELQVDVGDKLSYTDDPDAGILKRPVTFRNYDTSSLEGLFQSAERDMESRHYESALRKYLSCVEKEPTDVRSLTRIASLYYRRGEYPKALGYAAKALDFVMYDPDANFIYGIISRQMGDLTDAKETLGWAARSPRTDRAPIARWAGSPSGRATSSWRKSICTAHSIMTPITSGLIKLSPPPIVWPSSRRWRVRLCTKSWISIP